MNSVDLAVQKLLENNVVAIPTETVYGLAARIRNEEAIRKIFETKERPFFDPLIVHVKNSIQAQEYAKDWFISHQLLTEKFWPGPLTLVVNKKNIHEVISSGLPTVGLRCPNHPLTLSIIEKLNEPIAAPSANKFGKTSPTSAAHVRTEFGHDLYIVDGGNCKIGIESTIISIAESSKQIEITLHRSGSILQSQIRQVLKKLNKTIQFVYPINNKIVAPGQIEHHYMPNVPILWIARSLFIKNLPLHELAKKVTSKKFYNPALMVLSEEPTIAARELYSNMRKLSEPPNDLIIFVKEDYHINEYWECINDRLNRASSYKILD